MYYLIVFPNMNSCPLVSTRERYCLHSEVPDEQKLTVFRI